MIKLALRDALARFGIELRRNPYQDPFQVQRQLVTSDRPVILDIGAHHGAVVRRYRELFPNASIHAFEPFPDSLKILQQSVTASDLTSVHAVALSDSVGTAQFHVNSSDATNSLLATDGRADETWGPGLVSTRQTIQVPTDTLDRVMQRLKIATVDIMKIDVQGAEYQVFKGAHDLLSRGAIGLILTEIITAPTYDGQHALHDYLALFAGYDYRPMDFYNPIRRRGYLLQADLMFISPALQNSGRQLPL